MDWTELTEAFLAAKLHAFSPNIRRAYRHDLVACAAASEGLTELMYDLYDLQGLKFSPRIPISWISASTPSKV